jgi:hypothetical protein
MLLVRLGKKRDRLIQGLCGRSSERLTAFRRSVTDDAAETMIFFFAISRAKIGSETALLKVSEDYVRL